MPDMTPFRRNSLENESSDHPVTREQEHDEELRQYEVDGWRVGYEVEMNGVGAMEIVYGEDNGDSSDFPDTDEESVNGGEPCPYAGYQAIPTSNSRQEEPEEDDDDRDNTSEENETKEDVKEDSAIDQQSPSTDSTKIPLEEMLVQSVPYLNYSPKAVSSLSNVEKFLPAAPPSALISRIEHKPNDIHLDEEKTRQIQQAMQGFTLAGPPPILNDDWVKEMVQKMTKGSTA